MLPTPPSSPLAPFRPFVRPGPPPSPAFAERESRSALQKCPRACNLGCTEGRRFQDTARARRAIQRDVAMQRDTARRDALATRYSVSRCTHHRGQQLNYKSSRCAHRLLIIGYQETFSCPRRVQRAESIGPCAISSEGQL